MRYPEGYSPLNMHEHSPRLIRGDYWFYIRAKLTIIIIRILDFVVYTKKDEFMSVKNKHTLVGNPITG